MPSSFARVRLSVLLFLAIAIMGQQFTDTAPARAIPSEISLRVETPDYEITEGAIRVEGLEQNELAGAPALPVWSDVVELPHGTGWRISYRSPGVTQLPQRVALDPAPVPDLPERIAPEENYPSAISLQERPDPAIYQADALYPTSVVTAEEQWQRGKRLLALRVFPFQYNPIEQRILHHPELIITVHLDPAQVPAAGSPRGRTPEWLQAEPREPHQGSAAGVRIYTTERGLYRITYSELEAAGVPVATLDPRTFALSTGGVPVAIQVTGEQDGQFDPSDLVIFYAEPYSGRYMTQNLYWLTYGDGAGARVGTRTVNPLPGGVSTTTTQRTAHIEVNTRYMSTILRPVDGDRWFHEPMTAIGTTTRRLFYNFPLQEPVLSGSARLHAVFYGISTQGPYPNHSIRIRINDRTVGTYQWHGPGELVVDATFPASWLNSDSNRIALEAALSHFPEDYGLTSYVVYPDKLTLTYTSSARAVEGQEYIEALPHPSREIIVSGFSMDEVDSTRVWNVQDPTRPVELLSRTVENLGTSAALHFLDDSPSQQYVLSTENALRVPDTIEMDIPSQWRSASHSYDYIAIVPPELEAAFQPLLEHRAQEGLRVARVYVQDIYDEFNHGMIDPEAIRRFLTYAYFNWNSGGEPPEYVLLAGDGHYDYKNFLDTNEPNFIPPYLANVDPWIVETVADNRYVSVDGPDDYLPDMHLGRIPASSPEEAAAAVSKIIRYETTSPPGAWQSHAVFVADNPDNAGNFHQMSDQARIEMLPPSYSSSAIYYDPGGGTPYSTVEEMRAAIRAAFDDGALLLQWYGHGARFSWASERLLDSQDVPLLNATSAWPITISYSCWSSYYITLFNHEGSSDVLGERLLLTADRGAVADIGPTGLHVGSALLRLNSGIAEAMFEARVERVGAIADAGRTYVYTRSQSWHDLIDTTLLLGDPATRLRYKVEPTPSPTPTEWTTPTTTPTPNPSHSPTITITPSATTTSTIPSATVTATTSTPVNRLYLPVILRNEDGERR